MMDFRILLTLMLTQCVSIMGNYEGPDPWEVKRDVPKWSESEELPPDTSWVKAEEPCREDCDVGAWFYKRLLQFILNNGKFKEDDPGYMQGNLHFMIRSSNFKQISELIKSDVKLTEEGYRIGNEFIMEALVKPSYFEKIWPGIVFYVKHYYIYGVYAVIAPLATYIFWIFCRRTNFNAKFFFIAVCLLLFIWEVIIFYQEMEDESYGRLQSDLASCGLQFWRSDCTVKIPDMADWWKKFHPGHIVLRILTKLITHPIMWFHDDVIDRISNKLWYPLNVLTSIVLSMCSIYVLIFTAFSLFANVVLGKKVSMGLFNIFSLSLGGNITSKRRRSSDVSSNRIQQNTDTISGDNLSSLLKLTENFMVTTQTLLTNQIVSRNELNVRPTATQQKALTRSSSDSNLRESADKKITLFKKFKPRKNSNKKFQPTGNGDTELNRSISHR